MRFALAAPLYINLNLSNLIFNWPRLKLPRSVVFIPFSADEAPVLALPDESKGKQQYH